MYPWREGYKIICTLENDATLYIGTTYGHSLTLYVSLLIVGFAKLKDYIYSVASLCGLIVSFRCEVEQQ